MGFSSKAPYLAKPFGFSSRPILAERYFFT